ncbi:MAG: hypothetical protein DI551_05360 [Micavibrio aeruginosavorus]|uniref:Uncharacterized protein n=1 Tax=Micavibrio aeruginosavorus TaxID=349221 RepID=A0A2W5MZU4_9BACT|nr:MAG: hypothetical protein DI551_05360 [Micavibrio aeruginosavorus]
MKQFFTFFLLALVLISGNALAQEKREKRLTFKTPLDYTADDGIMSEDEMMEEAMYFQQGCSSNSYQKMYFDCKCLAGAYLQVREKNGPLMTHEEIFNIITNSKQTQCANTAQIAGTAYEVCITYAQENFELRRDNPEYCGCVANKLARDFTKEPRLGVGYVEYLRASAMMYCKDPKNRTTPQSAQNTTTTEPIAPAVVVPPLVKSVN